MDEWQTILLRTANMVTGKLPQTYLQHNNEIWEAFRLRKRFAQLKGKEDEQKKEND